MRGVPRCSVHTWSCAAGPSRDVQAAPVVSPSPDESSYSRSSEEDLITLPIGSEIHVRLADEVNSGHDKTDELYTGSADPSVLIRDHVVILRGTEAYIRLVEIKGPKFVLNSSP